jgi:S1-C subfamily serine protease
MIIMLALCSLGTDWLPIAEKLSKSVVYVEHDNGACTGFVVNDTAKNKDKESVEYILTAAHCEGPNLYADQTVAKVLWKDTKKDIMILEVADLNRPAVVLAEHNPKIGEEVASYGYGFALERPMFRTAHVADDKTYIPEDGIGGPLIVIDAGFVGGQSGGPVVNASSEVVSIVQRGGSGVGLGIGVETIKGKIGRYLPKKP